ncbi:MAG: hypothetical protein Q9163_001521 [Psora crenata]
MALDASKYEVLSRCLYAASGAVPFDQPDKLYLVNEENGELSEQLMVGGSKVDEDIIADNVKSKTPAAYLYQNNDERRCFCVGADNTLKYYKFTESWEPASLGSLPEQRIHPVGNLCGCFTPEGVAVYFQDPSGNLRGVEERKGVWRTLQPIGVDTQKRTPLKISFSEANSSFYLYYVGADGFLHYRTISSSGEESQDHIFPESKFGKPIENFIVFRGEDDRKTEAYFLTSSEKRAASSVFTRIDGDGKKATLGYSTGGKFEPDNNAQCTFKSQLEDCNSVFAAQIGKSVLVRSVTK